MPHVQTHSTNLKIITWCLNIPLYPHYVTMSYFIYHHLSIYLPRSFQLSQMLFTYIQIFTSILCCKMPRLMPPKTKTLPAWNSPSRYNLRRFSATSTEGGRSKMWILVGFLADNYTKQRSSQTYFARIFLGILGGIKQTMI